MTQMRYISADQIAAHLDFPDFIEALREGFRASIIAPVRHHHVIEKPDRANSTMLLMPAWTDFTQRGSTSGSHIGIKIATVSPDNASLGNASVQAVYLLSDGNTGEPTALIDGQALTFWRTACASALASDYLSKKSSSNLLMVGAGALAPWLVRAHKAVRPITSVTIWNRSKTNAQKLVKELHAHGIESQITQDLQTAANTADIISAATLSQKPLIKGEWLREGTHVDLVGGFTPEMREADDAAIKKCDLFVDTFAGALSEPGDIVQPIAANVISHEDILADLFDLTRGTHTGRTHDDQLTLFKSTGASLEDLAAAVLVAEKVS